NDRQTNILKSSSTFLIFFIYRESFDCFPCHRSGCRLFRSESLHLLQCIKQSLYSCKMLHLKTSQVEVLQTETNISIRTVFQNFVTGVSDFVFPCSGATNDQILVQKSMNWSAAQSYCREKYTDLISINTVQDNTKIAGLMLLNILNTQTAWIGLYKTSWEWSDGSNATYTNWKSGEPKDGKDCALMETSSASWSGEDCDKNHDFLCYQGGSFITVSAE
uniref:C-type lectin domain-containing protein n=1 Tax=Oreochromis aureus TaxID=47969 RepID=A0A668VE46_OREAU